MVEEDVTRPAASASRERLLQVYVDHRRWSSSQDTRWENGRRAARVQYAECDDRHGPPSFLRRRSMKHRWFGTVACQFRFSSSPGGSLPRGPHQIRTWRFPPSGSSADVARGSRATTVRSCGDMIRRRRSAGHGSLRTITPTRAAFARPGPGGYPFPGVIARMQPADSLIPIGLGSGRPLPSAYPGARATRNNEGLPGVRAVLSPACRSRRPRWVRSPARPWRRGPPWPSGCMRPWAPRKTLFRGCKAYGPLARVPTHRRLRLPRSPQGSLPAWVGWPLTGRGSHPLDDTQGFMTYSSIPLDRPAWPHRAPTPRNRWRVIPSGEVWGVP